MLAYGLFAYGYAFVMRSHPFWKPCVGVWRLPRQRQPLLRITVATALSRLEAEYGDPLAALDYFTLAIRNFDDSGNVAYIRFALATSLRSLTGSDAVNRPPPLPVAHSPLTAACGPKD